MIVLNPKGTPARLVFAPNSLLVAYAQRAAKRVQAAEDRATAALATLATLRVNTPWSAL